MYAKEGIHVYDVQEKGDIANGFKAGTISLKIRSNTDDESIFNKKCALVNKNIEKLGIQYNEVGVPTIASKANADIIPTNVKWNDTRVRQITDKKPGFEKKVMKPTIIPLEK